MSEKQTLVSENIGHNYDRRHIVARCWLKGHFLMNGTRHPLWKYLTFKMPDGQVFGAEFVRHAPVDRYGFLRTDDLTVGDIVVQPGLLYRKLLSMPAQVMIAHLKAMKTWRPPLPMMQAEIDTDTPPVDMGRIFLPKKL